MPLLLGQMLVIGNGSDKNTFTLQTTFPQQTQYDTKLQLHEKCQKIPKITFRRFF